MSRENIKTKDRYVNREISWLSFNERVLQEAEDKSTPLLMRIKFLGIFSNNRDEFFRVRVASLKRAVGINKKEAKLALGFSPRKILKEIHKTALKQQKRFEHVFNDILKELSEKHKIYIINENQLTEKQGREVLGYFHDKVRPVLVPLMLDDMPKFPRLVDGSAYLAVLMSSMEENVKNRFALIEVPTNKLSRFFVLKRKNAGTYVMLLDDVIRYALPDIFSFLGYDQCEAYTVKITKDAEMDIDNDVSKSFLELLSIGIKQREYGRPVRFIYDETMPKKLFDFLVDKMKINSDDNIIPAGRYHNFKDFMGFPDLGKPELLNRPHPPLSHCEIDPKKSLIKLIAQKDLMLHVPYHSYHPVIDFLREAAIDPQAEYIKVTLYRVAPHSNIMNTLINARRNGKKVLAVIELQARFDEKANIDWAKQLQKEGIKVIHGQQGIKIHSKLALVGRRENGKLVKYAYISTGNFHEGTAKVYADDGLFTAHKEITNEVNRVFDFIVTRKPKKFRHLLVSPKYMYPSIIGFIDKEIANAKAGKQAYLIAKLNSLNDNGMIDKLYEASQAGVQIRLIIRGICSLKSGVPGLSENIEIISIVDKYLEHSRVYIFCNNGKERCYISSADWMERNLHRRIEVSCPIYDEQLKLELKNMLSIQLRDNTKARIIDGKLANEYKNNKLPKLRAQNAIYDYFKKRSFAAALPDETPPIMIAVKKLNHEEHKKTNNLTAKTPKKAPSTLCKYKKGTLSRTLCTLMQNLVTLVVKKLNHEEHKEDTKRTM